MPLLPCLLLFLGVHGSTSHGSPAPLPPTYDASICSETFKCGGVDVRYPFYLSNATRETTEHTSNYSCGYTDLEISCQDEGWTSTPVIRLGSGGDNYTVQNIFYDDDDGHSGTIVLADSDVMIGGNTCPTVHHNVSFSEVWLNNTSSNDNLTFFFGCDSVPRLGVYRIDHYNGFKSPVAGVDSYSYVFTPKDRDQVQELQSARHCKEMVSVPVSEYLKMAVTVNNWTMFRTGGYGDVLEHGFELRWSRTTRDQCYPCEQSSGRCSYSQQSRGFLGCLCSYGKAHNSDCNASKWRSGFRSGSLGSHEPRGCLCSDGKARNSDCNASSHANKRTRICKEPGSLLVSFLLLNFDLLTSLLSIVYMVICTHHVMF